MIKEQAEHPDQATLPECEKFAVPKVGVKLDEIRALKSISILRGLLINSDLPFEAFAHIGIVEDFIMEVYNKG